MAGKFNENNHIVVINGSGGCGKDTFVELCRDLLTSDTELLNISTVDDAKRILLNMGWDGEKSEKARKALSDLKELWEEFNDGPTQRCVNNAKLFRDRINSIDKDAIVFIHCREPKYIDKLELAFDESKFNGTWWLEKDAFCFHTLLVENDNVEQITSNKSDADVYEYIYDWYIDNSSTLERLKDSAKWFLEQLGYDTKETKN